MIKVSFIENLNNIEDKLELYSSISRIPFGYNLFYSEFISMPSVIYARNINFGNFIEFRFEKESSLLFEINLVAINMASIINDELIDIIKYENKYFNCIVDYKMSKLEENVPMNILRGNNSVGIFWSELGDLSFYKLSEKCVIAVDNLNFIHGVIINNLSSKDISNILGL